MHRFVQSTSKGLADVTKTRSKQKQPTVQFIHESVRDFFLIKDGKQRLWPDLEHNFAGHSHDILKARCLAEINSIEDLGPNHSRPKRIQLDNESEDKEEEDEEDEEDEEEEEEEVIPSGSDPQRWQNNPFLAYATANLMAHANEAHRNLVSQVSFLPILDQVRVRWIRLHNLSENHKSRRYTEKASIICKSSLLCMELHRLK
jgi:hypothetical protein